MPMIHIDVQPLNARQRAELRERVVRAVTETIGSPADYVSLAICESEPDLLVEAGGSGPYDNRRAVAPAEA